MQQTDLVPDSELEYQEQLIQEREGEIEEIERGVLELNEIFRDLGTIVTEQQSMLGKYPFCRFPPITCLLALLTHFVV